MQDSSELRSLFLLGRLEGVSFLLLLGIAMPLKYVAGYPEAVRWVGWAHGLLFVLFVGALARAWGTEGWTLRRLAWGLVASVLPAGTFVFEHRVRQRTAPPAIDA